MTVPETGLTFLLNIMRLAWNAGGSNALTLHAAQNWPGVISTTVTGDFTECTFAGYAAQVLNTWSAPVLNPDGSYTCVDVVHTFTQTAGGGQVIASWFVTNAAGDLVFAFVGPNVAATPLPVMVQPNFTDQPIP